MLATLSSLTYSYHLTVFQLQFWQILKADAEIKSLIGVAKTPYGKV